MHSWEDSNSHDFCLIAEQKQTSAVFAAVAIHDAPVFAVLWHGIFFNRLLNNCSKTWARHAIRSRRVKFAHWRQA